MTQMPADQYSFLVGFDGDWRDTWWNLDFLELMARRWKLSEVKRALDVGCGVGHWGRTLLPYLPADATLTGVDREGAFAEKANEKARELGIAHRATYREGALEQLPFDDDTFDLVTCQTVLMHVGDVPRALSEMRRVCKPGGLLAAVEPDNLAEAATFLRGSKGPSWPDFLKLLDFQRTCMLGKAALGQGDANVGDLLPGHFARAGLTGITVHQSDRCPALIPPYQTRDEAIDLRQILEWIDAGVFLHGGGGRADTEKIYLAGGGDPARYDDLWRTAMAAEQLFKSSILSGAYDGGRAVTTYLVAGRKPLI